MTKTHWLFPSSQDGHAAVKTTAMLPVPCPQTGCLRGSQCSPFTLQREGRDAVAGDAWPDEADEADEADKGRRPPLQCAVARHSVGCNTTPRPARLKPVSEKVWQGACGSLQPLTPGRVEVGLVNPKSTSLSIISSQTGNWNQSAWKRSPSQEISWLTTSEGFFQGLFFLKICWKTGGGSTRKTWSG